jgi:hypothetical protein
MDCELLESLFGEELEVEVSEVLLRRPVVP